MSLAQSIAHFRDNGCLPNLPETLQLWINAVKTYLKTNVRSKSITNFCNSKKRCKDWEQFLHEIQQLQQNIYVRMASLFIRNYGSIIEFQTEYNEFNSGLLSDWNTFFANTSFCESKTIRLLIGDPNMKDFKIVRKFWKQSNIEMQKLSLTCLKTESFRQTEIWVRSIFSNTSKKTVHKTKNEC